MIASDARFYSSQERDDDKVDEEDDGGAALKGISLRCKNDDTIKS